MAARWKAVWRWLGQSYELFWVGERGRSRWRIRLRGGLWLLVWLLIGGFWWLVIAYTPLRYTIPGYPTRAFHQRYEELLLQVELLDHKVQQQAALIENLKQLSGAKALPIVAPQLMPTLQSRGYVIPIEGQVSRRFLPERQHWGIDITAAGGEPILAIGSGTVIFAEYSYQTGYVIAIQHSNGLVSLYKHNSRLLKEVGQKVQAGDVIALAGGLGMYSSGPHLHLETWIGGEPINPLRLLSY